VKTGLKTFIPRFGADDSRKRGFLPWFVLSLQCHTPFAFVRSKDKNMKTFIVYNLDTRLPVAVGEAIKAEWARFETADKTKISAENLIAEEIDSIRVLDSTGNIERVVPLDETNKAVMR
jgi:hypothetical protein